VALFIENVGSDDNDEEATVEVVVGLDCVDMGLDLSTDCAVVEFGRRFDADSCCIKRFCRRYEEESVLVIDAPETLVMLLEKLLGEDNIEYGFIEDDAEVGFV